MKCLVLKLKKTLGITFCSKPMLMYLEPGFSFYFFEDGFSYRSKPGKGPRPVPIKWGGTRPPRIFQPGLFCAFWLGNVLRDTTACTFRHLNFQKWSEHVVFCTFWLRTVLRATTTCTLSTSQLPNVLRACCVLYILASTCASRHDNGLHCSTSRLLKVLRCGTALQILICASRHNGVQCFISYLARWLRTRSFSEPTFRPAGATSHWKNNFPTFSRACIFFSSDSFSSLIFSLLPFSSLGLPTFAFPLVHIVGSLTSKLPSSP